jgi:hypothetical protein
MFFRAWVIHAKKRDGPGSIYMEIEIEIWMCRDERHVSAFRHVDRFPDQSALLAAPLRR